MYSYSYNDPVRFDGDIIITDPCYIINHDHDIKRDYPNRIEFVSRMYIDHNEAGDAIVHYPTPEEYPDCIEVTAENCKQLGIKWYDMDLNMRITGRPMMYSATLAKEIAAYDAAVMEYQNECHDDWERCEYGDAMEELGLTNFLCASTIYGDWSCTTYNEKTDEALGKFCADAGLVGVFLLEEVLKYNPKYDDIEKCPYAVTVIRDFHGEVELACEVDEEDGEEVVVRGSGNVDFYGRQTGF